MTFACSDTLLLSACSDNTLQIWDMSSSATAYVLQVQNIQILVSAFYHPLVAAVGDSHILIYNAISGCLIATLPARTLSVAFATDGLSIISGGKEESGLRVWDLRPLLDPRRTDDGGWVVTVVEADSPPLSSKMLTGPQVSSLTIS